MWFTKQQLERIDGLGGGHPTTVRDAGVIFRYLEAHPGTPDAELRRWAEQADVSPERYNRALRVLAQARLVFDLGGNVSVTGGPQSDGLAEALAGPPSIPFDVLTQAELRAVADRLHLDVPKSATKERLAEAILAAPSSAD